MGPWRRLFSAATVSSGHPMRTSGRRYSTGRSVVRCSPASGTAGQVVKHPRSSSGTSGPCRGSGRLSSVRCGHSGWRTPCVGGGRSATWHGGYGFVRSVFGSTFSSEWARRDGSNSVIHFSTQESWRLARRSPSAPRSSPCSSRVFDRRRPRQRHGLPRFGPRQSGARRRLAGEDVDQNLVDIDALAREWSLPQPDPRTYLLMQSIALARERRVAGDVAAAGPM